MAGDVTALYQLREQLLEIMRDKGLNRTRLLEKAQLADPPEISWGTLSNALNHKHPAPTRETVSKIARLLGVRKGVADELDELCKRALGETGVPRASTVVAVTDASPAELEIHQAVLPALDSGDYPFLTPYVCRAHDQALRARLAPALAGGPSVLVILTGGSSTGKTRAAYEALCHLAPDRPLHRPQSPEGLLRLVHSGELRPGDVLWLNEAQRVLQRPGSEQAAAALRTLLLSTPGVAAVGTLWTDPYWRELTRPGVPGDPHAMVRALLQASFTHRVAVPAELSQAEAHEFAEMARRKGDRPLQDALKAGQRHGRVVQHLSGGPELLNAYLLGPGEHFTAAEHALITAVVDARRLGYSGPLTAGLLGAAAWNTIPAHHRAVGMPWPGTPLRALSTGERDDGNRTRTDIRGTLSAFTVLHETPDSEPVYDVADYLEQHAGHHRADEPAPPYLWDALTQHTADPDTCLALAQTAWERGFFKQAIRLDYRAALVGGSGAAARLVWMLEQTAGVDDRVLHWVVEQTDLTDPSDVSASLEAFFKVGDAEPALILLRRDPIAQVKLTSPSGIADLLAVLLEIGASTALERLLARDPVSQLPVSQPFQAARLLEVLTELGAHEEATKLARRCAGAVNVSDDHTGGCRLLRALRAVGADDAVNAVRNRLVDAVDVTDPSRVMRLLVDLRRSGGDSDVRALLDRNPTAHADLRSGHGIKWLLEELCDLGRKRPYRRYSPATRPHTWTSPTRGVWPTCWTGFTMPVKKSPCRHYLTAIRRPTCISTAGAWRH
ncbi:helix-turn-helix transcriptional regulator [Streptomyces sp. ISL-22]|uniref:helix-turn-helix domain-containing protein n=1 Tax=unclassified Streptomyces TaxID=2593676 RepID=UPI001BE53469|nr:MULTISPECIES: helix-turn-helix transcriptional regulator [unclassified Streptomyces]MBT2423410.1 helix-turn-helix transcriptional regulator [Streptomyces sp. ISL-24]MBT2433815.1 helix-turn-helix transcriptional regulator [Streptomyces sp. ISL-22]